MTLTEAVKNRDDLRGQLRKLVEDTEKTKTYLNEGIEECDHVIRETEAGLDSDKIQLAESFLKAGDVRNCGSEGGSAISDAMSDLATGGEKLKGQYFGAKNYDRWSGQRSDHPYGYGPKHGSICFSVGLLQDARERELTADEIEAGIYYLAQLAKIQAVRRAETEVAA